MLGVSFADQAYERLRYPTVLDHGAQRRDLTAEPARATFYGSVQPGSGAIDPINRDGSEVVYTIWGGVDDDVDDQDLVDYAGATYFVNGEPERWRTSVLDHMVVRLSRWEG